MASPASRQKPPSGEIGDEVRREIEGNLDLQELQLSVS
jgi:hypothetical protein